MTHLSEILGHHRVGLSHDMRLDVVGTNLFDRLHRVIVAFQKMGINGMQEQLKTEGLSQNRFLELIVRAKNPPGNDGNIARRMLGYKEEIISKKKDLRDYLT